MLDALRKRIAAVRQRETAQQPEQVSQLKAELEIANRKCLEYHRLIEGILGERDVWKDMYYRQVRGHLNAQAMCEKFIMTLRQQLHKALQLLNALRREHGLEEVKTPKDLGELDAHPVGGAEKFAERMARARALISEDTDGLAERDRIAGDS